MFALIVFVLIAFIFPIIIFSRLFLENREDKIISYLSLFDIILFVTVMIIMLNFYIPHINQVNDIGTDVWYSKFINSEKGEAYRLK